MGAPDSAKFSIFIPSRKRDQEKPGQYIEGKGTTYTYPRQIDFDWNDVKHIKSLHQWREQVFRRRIGGVRPTRHFWLESEKQLLLKILGSQLERHRRPKWNKLTNLFNRYFQSRVQPKGLKLVYPGKKKNGGLLEQDRLAPWRTRSALEEQAFKWPEYHEKLKARDDQDSEGSSDENAQPSSDDEVEVEDPAPEQNVFKPANQAPWRKPGSKPYSQRSTHITQVPPSTTSTSVKAQIVGGKRKREENSEQDLQRNTESDGDLSDLGDPDDERPV